VPRISAQISLGVYGDATKMIVVMSPVTKNKSLNPWRLKHKKKTSLTPL
jgi:hypothetical protein